ncbi:endonuclease/exonuclease/phosphatase [Intrasporangium oryzae NRRL B-24470]|uniref:Endonuclease/exonuclease/phosphatase n=1 Tax=Intrasporangium oryzae NRRL B-24470 TaxID=1386089 RepID=W9G4U8_9MICO|nr:endonuclease/exonuclease/phosphatase [Intrasporangium oryzae NRRL B-24470]
MTTAALAVAIIPFVAAPAASAAPTELFFSEYIEGSSNNKALEIYNGTGSPIDLGAGGYTVQMFFNGSSTAGLTIGLSGTVASGDVFVLAQATASATILAQADQTNAASWYNGDDAVVLRKGTTVIDSIGQVGVDPGTEWGTGLTSTADNTLRRKATIAAGDVNGSDAFDPAVEWDGFAVDTFDGLGSHTIQGPVTDAAPTVASTSPADGATGVAASSNLSVTFSEPVDVTASAFALVCSSSGTKTLAVTGGPSTFTLDPSTDLAASETCTLTVSAAGVTDQDTNDPPDTMAADFTASFTVAAVDPCTLPFTPVPAIQGSGATVALTGTVTTQGVVVGDYEGASPALRGFYLQDAAGDGDPATSDGIFVFEGNNANTVVPGDVVRVTGTAGENQGQSQISVGTIRKCGTGTVAPTPVTFPVASDTALERVEGMLVTMPQQMTVTEHFQLGRFGQVVLSEGGRLKQPTNVVSPGADALALQADNDLRKIILDDASQSQNPDPILFARDGQPLSASNTLRGGDTATGIVGVMTYTWAGNSASGNAYRVRPVNALGGTFHFESTNERPTAAPAVGGTTRVVGMNLLNFFNTFDGLPDTVDNCANGVGGAATDCRGADTPAEFDRQWPKTVAAVNGTGADVVAFMEMENDGYGPGSAEQFLVDKLNADAPGTWAFIDADAATGETNALGTDAIKVGLLFKPAKVTPVGKTAVLNSVEFVNGGDSSPRNRPSLAQAFRDRSTGGIFVAVANHLKSKGSACDDPDAGDGQGNCNAVRTVSAQLLAEWLAGDPTETGDADVLVLGDMNSYAKEDPITTLETAGFHNLIEELDGPDAYSYVFDGQWGYLDHALGSTSVRAQVTGVADWHINADEPSVLDYNTDFKTANLQSSLYAPDAFRISDHDPVVVGLDLTNAAPVVGTVANTSPVRAGTPFSVTAPFTDADRLDTHTATIAWGDGTTSAGTVDGSTRTVTGTHTYATAGLYPVTVSVSDGWGNSASGTTTAVVYDPAAGFLTGTGYVLSPAGALVSDPAAKGKGKFAVTAKYESGASMPTGSLTFSLDGSTFSVASSSFDWLVVTGGTAVLAGDATVNGTPGYRVELTATDGGKKVDSLRLVVRQGTARVYDSGVQTVQGQVTVHP